MDHATKLNVTLSLLDVVAINDSINFEMSQLTELNYNPNIKASVKLENNERIEKLKELKHSLIDSVVNSMLEDLDYQNKD
jgi:hypothetical protein